MRKSIIRKLFPGSNSAYGFFSYYDQIAGFEANRIIIFKGGPGVGKSSFMRKIGHELYEHGYSIEYHYCSSDNKSIDALYIPEKRAALMDGTAPHVVDPVYPGAVEEIINLGEYWDADRIREHKPKIVELQKEISLCFQQVYRLLAVAKLCQEAVENCYQPADEAVLDCLVADITKDIAAGEKKGPVQRPRRLFASAITPGGFVNYLPTLTDHLSRVYLLNGENAVANRKIISGILETLVKQGFFVEVFCCALDPHRVDHLVVPELDVAVINSVSPHLYTSSGSNIREINVEALRPALVKTNFSMALWENKEELGQSMDGAFQTAFSFLSRAKLLHDELEQYYIPHMNFDSIDRVREQVLASLLN